MDRITIVVDRDLEPIIPRYFELQRRELADLLRDAAAGNAESVRLIGHKMKGTGASYGFPRFTEFGAAIEQAAGTGDLEAAAKLARTAGEYLERVHVIYGEETP